MIPSSVSAADATPRSAVSEISQVSSGTTQMQEPQGDESEEYVPQEQQRAQNTRVLAEEDAQAQFTLDLLRC